MPKLENTHPYRKRSQFLFIFIFEKSFKVEIHNLIKLNVFEKMNSTTNETNNNNNNKGYKRKREETAAETETETSQYVEFITKSAAAAVVPVVCFNLFKGGVSKTTSLFNMAWHFASQGVTVLLVDTDAQCNLSQLFLNGAESELDRIYGDDSGSAAATAVVDLLKGLSPVMNGNPLPDSGVETLNHPVWPNLHLLPGSMFMSEYEESLSSAERSLMPMTKNLHGACFNLVQRTARKVGAHVVFVDTSPNMGQLNMQQIMTAHLVVFPAEDSYFAKKALDSLQKWFLISQSDLHEHGNYVDRIKRLRTFTSKSQYPMPTHWPRFVGCFLQGEMNVSVEFQSKLTKVMTSIHSSKPATIFWASCHTSATTKKSRTISVRCQSTRTLVIC